MIYLISRKYAEDTTDSMLFTPIVEDVIKKVGRENVVILASGKNADVNIGEKNYLLNLFWYGIKNIKRNDTVFVTSTPPFLSITILTLRMFKKFRVIYQIQDLYPDIMKFLDFKYRIIYYLVYPFAYLLYKHVDTFLTISDNIKKQIVENYAINPSRIIVAENWTDIDSIEFSERKLSNKIIYIGNIGRAHDYSYFLEYVMKKESRHTIVIKTDNTSKIKLFKSSTSLANGLKDYTLPDFIEWNHTRYNKEVLAKFLSEFDYSIVFLGKGFDRILFPCKIYASLSLLMPVIFFGPEDSFINLWLEKNNLGFHYSKIDENYLKINFYRKHIYEFNQSNTFSQKVNIISKTIIS